MNPEARFARSRDNAMLRIQFIMNTRRCETGGGGSRLWLPSYTTFPLPIFPTISPFDVLGGR